MPPTVVATRQHAAEVAPLTAPNPIRFRPRHCAGTDCLHDHPGEGRRFRAVLPFLARATAATR